MMTANNKQKPKILIICMANYCRSPVAEVILRSFIGNKYDIYSAGLRPMSIPDMDNRSRTFLENNGFENLIHYPKKLSRIDVISSKYIYAMDHFILLKLNNLYPKFTKKIKIFSCLDHNVKLHDPYNFEDREYDEIMQNILNLSKQLSKAL